MNDVLVRKQARAVRIDEYLILQGEPDWSKGLLFGAFQVREINDFGHHTVAFSVRPAPGALRRVLPSVRLEPAGFFAISNLVHLVVDRGQIMTRYSGALPPPLWMITEVP